MKKTLYTLALLLLIPVAVFSAPNITDISGILNDGETLVINGSGFGSHSLNIEWLGGASGNIESGLADQPWGNSNGFFEGPGWAHDNWSTGARSVPRYSTLQAYSHNQSIECGTPYTDQYTCGFQFDTGSANLGTVWVAFWYYFDRNSSETGQRKEWRLRPDSNYNDISGEVMSSLGTPSAGWNNIYCHVSQVDQCYPDGNRGNGGWYDSDDTPPNNQWNRLEVNFKESSAEGVKDGTWTYKYMSPTGYGNQAIKSIQRDLDWEDNIITRATGISARWRYWIFEGFFSVTNTDSRWYFDDFYMQWGAGQARVEIVKESDFSVRRHSAIQVPISWDDNTISITVNIGGFDPSESIYINVVNAAGVSANIPAQFGQTYGPEPSEASIKGVKITSGN